MTFNIKILLALCGLLSVQLASAKFYEHFKAYDFTVTSFDTVEKLEKWHQTDGVDFWKFGAPGVESRVMYDST